MAHDVFLSHSSKDKQIADEVVLALETAGIKCWIAPRDIGTGEIFPVAIAEAIANSKLMVLIFSENSNTSKDVANELILAMDESIKTIPFRIEDVKPKGAMRYYLTGAQWLEATTPPKAENLQNLIQTVNSLIVDLTLLPLTIDNTNPHDGQAETPYSFTFKAAGGVAPYEYSLKAGKLPSGLNLDAEGTLSGKPLKADTYIFAVQTKDAKAATDSHIYTLVTEPAPLPLTIDTFNPHDGQADSSYSYTFKSAEGVAPYKFSLKAGKLPPGLELNSDGTLSGTLLKPGKFNFTVQVEDSALSTESHRFTLAAEPAPVPLKIDTVTPPDAQVDSVYSFTFNTTGGSAPYKFSLKAGKLPPGLELNSDGTLSGTPKKDSNYRFAVQVEDATSATDSHSFTMTTKPPPVPLTIDTTNPHDASVDSNFRFTFKAEGGAAPYKYSAKEGKLPDGLKLDVDGTLSGMPTQEGTFVFAVQVTDAASANDSLRVTLVIKPAPISLAIDTAAPKDAQVDAEYSFTFKVTGGVSPYKYFKKSGKLPPGLKLSSDGILSGTPLKTGNYTFAAQVKDASSVTASHRVTLAVKPVLLPVVKEIVLKEKPKEQKLIKPPVFKNREWAMRFSIAAILVIAVSAAVYLLGGVSDDEETVDELPVELPVEEIVNEPSIEEIIGETGYLIDNVSGTIPLSDLEIGSRVVDPSWEWEYRTESYYSGSGKNQPVIWIIAAKNHYEGLPPHVTLLAEDIIGLYAFDNSIDRGHQFGHNHWGLSGTGTATKGLRPWLNGTGIHAGEGFFDAFSDDFKNSILKTNLSNLEWKKGSYYYTSDHVFIPSTTEIGDTLHEFTKKIGNSFQYFDGAADVLRKAKLDEKYVEYWTRSPSMVFSYSVRSASSEGSLFLPGNFMFTTIGYTNRDYCGVRPVLNLKAGTLVTKVSDNGQAAEETRGNRACNIASGGYAALQGDWIY